MIVADASVLIAVLDPADALHAEATAVLAESWAAGEPIVVPAMAYAEAMIGPMRAGGERLRTADAFFGRLAVEALTPEEARAAAGLRARHPGLRMPDALILAAGVSREATVLTGDARWAAMGDWVRVVRSSPA